MKRENTIYTILMIVTLITAFAAVFALYVCITCDNEPNWVLPIALILVTIGNGLTYFANKRRNKNKEDNNE